MSEKINFNRGWLFSLGDEPNADYMGYDDAAWQEVTLPHDWSVELPFNRACSSGTGYLPGGTAWYRKHFTLPETACGKRVRITFGGVYKHARIWINSNYLGERAYGYSTYTFDISAFIKPGENVISVRVEHNDLADSRWFTGSGIYRDVTLEISDPCAFCTDGLFVSTERADEKEAVVKICYETYGAKKTCFQILDAAGCTVAKAEAAGACGEVLMTAEHPDLWSPDSPVLYTLQACVLDGEMVKDQVLVRFGVRTLRFDPDEGFFLNGKNMKLKGVCVHHDAGALGAAVPKTVWARRLRKFKEAGCNALRTAHNPPDPALLDLCDEMGLLVMDEAFDEWEGIKNKWWQGHNVYPPKRYGYGEDFPAWHRADLEGMVKRDRNHPCVILWSIGNEIDYPNDPYVSPIFEEVFGNNDSGKPAQERKYDPCKPDAARLQVLAHELVQIVHGCDTTRPVTAALAFPELSNRVGYADELDLVSYNYKEGFYEEDHKKYPDRVFCGSENGYSLSAWKAVTDHAYICGQFLWTGIDFLGECPGWPARISRAGMLTLAGFEKPRYYQRKAMWSDESFAKITVWHENSAEEDFSWSGKPGEPVRVRIYTQADTAELFLNGQSMGVREAGIDREYFAEWEMQYVPGTLRACAGGAEDVLCSSGTFSAISLEADRQILQADEQDVVQIEVSLRDEQNHLVCTDDQRIYYQLMGDGTILGIENGRNTDLTPYAASYRSTWNGRAIVYVRAGTVPGDLTLHAYTRSGVHASVTFTEQES